MKKLLILLIVCSIIICSVSDSYGQVKISGAFAQDTVVIGDDIDFTISLEVDKGTEVLAVAGYFLDSIYSALQSVKARTDTTQPIIPTIADFELISAAGWEDKDDDGVYVGDELDWDITTIGSQRLLEKTFTLKLWDPGNNIVLYPIVVYTANGVQEQTSQEGEMAVFVAPPGGLPPNQDSLQVAPIKNIKEEASNLSDYIVYFIIIGLALLSGLAYWWYSKYYKNRKTEVPIVQAPIIYVPADQIALKQLADLRSKKLWQQGDIKGYQSELTHIIRQYLEGRYDISALESTTEEIVKSLMSELQNNDDITSLKRILQVADLVKFAKATPEEDIHESFMKEAEEFVERTADETKKVVVDDITL